MAETKLTNLFDPEVVSDLFEAKLCDAIKLAPLCNINTDLVGRPGSTITVPQYSYIGTSETVAEGETMTPSVLAETTATATVHKLGKAVEITDEAALSGYGDPLNEATNQLVLSVADGLEAEIYTTLSGIASGMTHAASAMDADAIADALELFGEDIEGEKVIVVEPAYYTAIRKANGWISGTELGAERIIEGSVGKIHGCEVIVSNRLKSKNVAYVIKPGALQIYLKRDTNVESDRDILKKSTVISVDKHEVTYLYDKSKAIKITY